MCYSYPLRVFKDTSYKALLHVQCWISNYIIMNHFQSSIENVMCDFWLRHRNRIIRQLNLSLNINNVSVNLLYTWTERVGIFKKKKIIFLYIEIFSSNSTVLKSTYIHKDYSCNWIDVYKREVESYTIKWSDIMQWTSLFTFCVHL